MGSCFCYYEYGVGVIKCNAISLSMRHTISKCSQFLSRPTKKCVDERFVSAVFYLTVLNMERIKSHIDGLHCFALFNFLYAG